MIKKLIALFIFINITFGCTKDDICSGETPTTPLLIISFKNFNNPSFSKTVEKLSVTTQVNDETAYIYKYKTTDSIAIPLRTNQDFTDFLFIENDSEDNPGNTDHLTFSYQRDNIYINRACAFKAIFKNVGASLENEEIENWIDQIEINTTTIENEEHIHVTILH